MKYDGISFNGPHLAKFSKAEFVREVKHLFKGEGAKEKMDEAYRLIQEKYNPKKQSEPAPEVKESEN